MGKNKAELSAIKWLQDQMDDLDVLIAQNDFEEAVRHIEKGLHSFIYIF